MNAIEQMLTKQMDMSDFTKFLNTDESIQEVIRGFVPKEAICDSNHAFWQNISQSVVQEYDFDYLEFLRGLCRFNGTLGDNLNIFSIVSRAYRYYAPHLDYTTYYNDAFRLYLKAVGEYYEGPEVTHILNQIVSDALSIKPKSKCIKEIRLKLKEVFHIVGTKRPYWIQGGEWPMGKHSPMKFIGQSKIPDGKQYFFQDVDTGETRSVEQYY